MSDSVVKQLLQRDSRIAWAFPDEVSQRARYAGDVVQEGVQRHVRGCLAFCMDLIGIYNHGGPS